MTQAPALVGLSHLSEQLSGGCSLEEAEDMFGSERLTGLCKSGIVTLHRSSGFVDCSECGEPHSEPTQFDGERRRWYWMCRGNKHYLPAPASQVALLDYSALLLALQQLLGLDERFPANHNYTSEPFVLLGAIRDPDRTIFLSMSVNTIDSLASLFAGVQRGSKQGGWILTLGPAPTLDPPRYHEWLEIDARIAIDSTGALQLVDRLPWASDGQPVATREDRHRAMWAIFQERGPSRRIDSKRRLWAEAKAISDQMPAHLKLQPGTVENLIGKAFWAEQNISHDKPHD